MGDPTATAGPTENDAEHGHEGEHRSRWPFVAAAGAAALYAGAALSLLAANTPVAPPLLGYGLVGLGVLGIVVGLAGWVAEAFLGVEVTGAGKPAGAYRTTTVLFLATDVATFGAGFVYYFFVRAGPWPPGPLPELLGSLVLANTALLLVSSGTLHVSHLALERDNRPAFLGLLAVTVLLGLAFLVGQALEYWEFVVHGGYTLSSGVYWSAFFGLTGLHGLHVALGVVFLGVVLGRGLRGEYDATSDTSVGTASLYWHFVDVVWVFLVVVLYAGAELGF